MTVTKCLPLHIYVSDKCDNALILYSLKHFVNLALRTHARNNEWRCNVDIIQSIDRFIESRSYHYVLLINGKWGSGKTYFVKQELIPHLSLIEHKPSIKGFRV